MSIRSERLAKTMNDNAKLFISMRSPIKATSCAKKKTRAYEALQYLNESHCLCGFVRTLRVIKLLGVYCTGGYAFITETYDRTHSLPAYA